MKDYLSNFNKFSIDCYTHWRYAMFYTIHDITDILLGVMRIRYSCKLAMIHGNDKRGEDLARIVGENY
jgi:hypothetical protein